MVVLCGRVVLHEAPECGWLIEAQDKDHDIWTTAAEVIAQHTKEID